MNYTPRWLIGVMRPAGDLCTTWAAPGMRTPLKMLVRVYGIGYLPRANVRLALTMPTTKSSRMQEGSLCAHRCTPFSCTMARAAATRAW